MSQQRCPHPGLQTSPSSQPKPALLQLLSSRASRPTEPPRPATSSASLAAVVRGGDRQTRPAGPFETCGGAKRQAGVAVVREACPVCGELFPTSELQAHVEAELDALEAAEREATGPPPGQTASRAGLGATADRLSSTQSRPPAVVVCPLCGEAVAPGDKAAHLEAELAPLRAAVRDAAAALEAAQAQLAAAGFHSGRHAGRQQPDERTTRSSAPGATHLPDQNPGRPSARPKVASGEPRPACAAIIEVLSLSGGGALPMDVWHL